MPKIGDRIEVGATKLEQSPRRGVVTGLHRSFDQRAVGDRRRVGLRPGSGRAHGPRLDAQAACALDSDTARRPAGRALEGVPDEEPASEEGDSALDDDEGSRTGGDTEEDRHGAQGDEACSHPIHDGDEANITSGEDREEKAACPQACNEARHDVPDEARRSDEAQS
jgi:hypothetical protein